MSDETGSRHYDGILRDRFSADYDSAVSGPVENGSQTTIGPFLSQIKGSLCGGGQPLGAAAWGASRRLYSAIARRPGRVLRVGPFAPEDKDALFAILVAAGDITDDPRTAGLYGWHNDAGQLAIGLHGQQLILAAGERNTRPAEYMLLIGLDDAGGWIGLAMAAEERGRRMDPRASLPAWPSFRLLAVSDVGDLSPIHALLSYAHTLGYPYGHVLEELEWRDVAAWASPDGMAAFADRFSYEDGPVANGWTAHGAWRIVGGRLRWTPGSAPGPDTMYWAAHATDLPNGDGLWLFRLRTPATMESNPVQQLLVRWTDSFNHVIVKLDGNALYIDVEPKMGQPRLVGIGRTWTADTEVLIIVETRGPWYRVWQDNTLAIGWTEDPLARHLAATGIGVQILDLGGNATGSWSKVAAYPTIISAPAELLPGPVPAIYAAGLVLAGDDFAGTDGTSLAAHAPDVGAAWSIYDNAPLVLQGNRLVLAASGRAAGANLATQDTGAADVIARVRVSMPASFPTGYIGAGIIVRRVLGEETYLLIQLIKNPLQLLSDEIELLQIVGGVAAGVVRKVNLGDALVANRSFVLEVQVCGNRLLVMLDGAPQIAYRVWNADLLRGTSHGLHIEYYDDGTRLDNWTVATIAGE